MYDTENVVQASEVIHRFMFSISYSYSDPKVPTGVLY